MFTSHTLVRIGLNILNMHALTLRSSSPERLRGGHICSFGRWRQYRTNVQSGGQSALASRAEAAGIKRTVSQDETSNCDGSFGEKCTEEIPSNGGLEISVWS